jgi:hypothetical protein
VTEVHGTFAKMVMGSGKWKQTGGKRAPHIPENALKK